MDVASSYRVLGWVSMWFALGIGIYGCRERHDSGLPERQSREARREVSSAHANKARKGPANVQPEQASKIHVVYRGSNLYSVSLSPDRRQVTFSLWSSSAYSRKEPSELFTLDRASGKTKRLYGSALQCPEWSSHSKYIAGIDEIYAGLDKPHPRVLAAPSFRQALVVVDATNGKQVARVEAANVEEKLHLAGWFPDARRVLFEQYVEARSERSPSINKGEDLMKVLDIVRGKCEVFPRKVAGYSVKMLRVAPTDGLVAATCDDGDLATFRINTDRLTALTQDGGWGEGKGRNGWSQWSPDGHRLAYSRILNPYRFELWTITRDGKQKSMLAEQSCTSYVVWSADGSALAWIGSEIPGITPRKNDVVPGVETPISPARPNRFGGYTGPYSLYVVKVPDGKPRCVLNAPVGVVAWESQGTLVCCSQGAIFEVKP